MKRIVFALAGAALLGAHALAQPNFHEPTLQLAQDGRQICDDARAEAGDDQSYNAADQACAAAYLNILGLYEDPEVAFTQRDMNYKSFLQIYMLFSRFQNSLAWRDGLTSESCNFAREIVEVHNSTLWMPIQARDEAARMAELMREDIIPVCTANNR